MARKRKLAGGGTFEVFETEFFIKTTASAFDAIEIITGIYETKLKEKITGPRSGRIYRIGKTAFRRASSPGQPPGVKFSGLLTGIDKFTRKTRRGVEGIVGTDVFYAPFLERGTKFMLPRPAWVPVMKEIRDDIIRVFNEAK